MITRTIYRKKLDRAENRLVKRIAAYRKDPSVKNVHDLRTATRRLLAVSQLLPKHVRERKKVRKQLDHYDKLMGMNAEPRDLDIMLDKIEHHPTRSLHRLLQEDFMKKRKENVEQGTKYASSLKYQARLQVPLRQVSDSQLQKRFEKVTRKYRKKIKSRTKTVVKDAENTAELHRLREDVRMLRYILDLETDAEIEKQVNNLKTWQDILGEIHDSDIFIKRLDGMKNESSEINNLLESEIALRARNYMKFKSMASTITRDFNSGDS